MTDAQACPQQVKDFPVPNSEGPVSHSLGPGELGSATSAEEDSPRARERDPAKGS